MYTQHFNKTQPTKCTSENSVSHIPSSRQLTRTAVLTKSARKLSENVRTKALVPP